jgi:hypothetical protein
VLQHPPVVICTTCIRYTVPEGTQRYSTAPIGSRGYPTDSVEPEGTYQYTVTLEGARQYPAALQTPTALAGSGREQLALTHRCGRRVSPSNPGADVGRAPREDATKNSLHATYKPHRAAQACAVKKQPHETRDVTCTHAHDNAQQTTRSREQAADNIQPAADDVHTTTRSRRRAASRMHKATTHRLVLSADGGNMLKKGWSPQGPHLILLLGCRRRLRHTMPIRSA